MANTEIDPLFGAEPSEVPLASAPLASVVAQVKFTPILRIRSQDFIVPFQDQIRLDYPKMRREQTKQIALFGSTDEEEVEVIWRFLSGNEQWRVSLATSFIALETRAYTSRTDFVARLKSVADALKTAAKSAQVTRVGVRYIDHIKVPEIDQINKLMRPELLGIAGALQDRMQHSVSEMLCEIAEGSLLARWGLLPPNGTHDVNALPPVDTKSWFLDLDAFKQYEEPVELDVDAIHSSALALATRCYAVFRWLTTEEFLKVYGG